MSAEAIHIEAIRVEVVYALPQQSWIAVMELPIGATASEAVARSGFGEQVPAFDGVSVGYAIFGKTVSAATVLRDGDRLELVRPLIADPKQARRRRAKHKP